MKYIFTILLFYAFVFSSFAQIYISGACVEGTFTLTFVQNVNGKPAYQGSGLVAANAGVTINVYWLGAPDNLWLIDFDGQPYFSSTCAFATPPLADSPECNWTAVHGVCTGTEPVVLNDNTTLPVTFIDFYAQRDREVIRLNWLTATELNNKGFEVQRSQDAKQWNKIGFVNSDLSITNIHQYSFIDQNPLKIRSYYRLRQIDQNNNFLYSKIINVEFNSLANFSLKNSFGKGLFFYTIHDNSANYILDVFNIDGRRIYSGVSGNGDSSLDLTAYPAGAYILQIKNNGEIHNFKLIKI